MRVNHELINISALARKMGVTQGLLRSRIETINTTFTPEELEQIKTIYEDLFCYLFEVDEVIPSNLDVVIQADKVKQKTADVNNPKTTTRERDLGERAFINGALWVISKLKLKKEL